MDSDKQSIVKLDSGCCSCQVLDFSEIPCAHALAILQKRDEDTYSYIYEYYHSRTLFSTYKRCAQPVGVHSNWRVVDDEIIALPPIMKRQAGRPKKQRILSIGELKNSSKCSRCNRKGHNSRTYKVGSINE